MFSIHISENKRTATIRITADPKNRKQIKVLLGYGSLYEIGSYDPETNTVYFNTPPDEEEAAS